MAAVPLIWSLLKDHSPIVLQLHYNHVHFTALWILSGVTRVSRYQKKHTHSHLSWSSFVLYLHPPSTAIHRILPVQFTRLTVFLHNLCLNLLWSTSWSGILHSIPHSLRYSPKDCVLFAAHAYTIATCFAIVARLYHPILDSVSTHYLKLLSFTLMPHIHMTIFISARWRATSFSFVTG